MCEALRTLMEPEIKEAEQKGIQQGLQQAIENLMMNKGLSFESALEALSIPESDKDLYHA